MPSDYTDPSDAATWSPLQSKEWHEARRATAALRDVLIAAGLQQQFPFLRADLNAFGQGFVELGRTTPRAAERLAHLLRLGLDCPQQPQRPADGPAADHTEGRRGSNDRPT